RRPSTRYRQRPRGGTPGSRVTTLIAADVPTLSAMRVGSTQSEPTLLAAPSPTAENQLADLNAGHRLAQGARKPRRGSARPARRKRCRSSNSAAARASASQRPADWSKRPVADAIETLVVA